MRNSNNDIQEMIHYVKAKREDFQQKLLSEAVNVAEVIHDILKQGNIDLLKNAERLVVYILENNDQDIVVFAKQEGVAWAQYSLTLAFKLEWVQAIRRSLWKTIYEYQSEFNLPSIREDFFELEERINNNIDQFLNTFFLSYSDFKDELIHRQRKNVEHLSVPIIPISPTVAILPLIGTIDSYRMDTIEEKVLTDIARTRIHTLIMDLSGITDMEVVVIDHFHKVLDGINMMGCKSVITGLRPELVREMIHLGINFNQKAITKGTLQQSLKDYLL
ncbi:STAS domain-containing protein [Priestia filamentosa]|uniref:Anti-anti-sigma factor n=2 Tax=Priestia filamentosa TaxID=1402861 RepID=A0A1X7EHR9_9BACI|nr:STAS domain-containing protein [Priestia filamentosa]AKO92937.1 anti-anti-sigma factor [Priestia filamentosa]MDT3763068.1 STAS domain-containing protein [Priestia filamentosa]OXS69585.1 anti-anti-sigma factor [Priestia filamentosa]RJS63765.1 STAS domain-containing protein [Priestia filamentosa]WCM14090.1 STAS domain-containing protein [Priestia filamentosa]